MTKSGGISPCTMPRGKLDVDLAAVVIGAQSGRQGGESPSMR